jgi:hypothetical protein
MHFRVDGRPARINRVADLAEGEPVTLVGYDGGEVHALAVRNDRTRLVYYEGGSMSNWITWMLVGCLIGPASLMGLAMVGYALFDPIAFFRGAVLFLGLAMLVLSVGVCWRVSWGLRRQRRIGGEIERLLRSSVRTV